MPFTEKSFPGRTFATFKEYEDACAERTRVQKELQKRGSGSTKLVAKITPLPEDALERRIFALESRVDALENNKTKQSPKRPDAGTILTGESQGTHFSLEVLPDGFLCSDGIVYPSLSAAAEGVSGNRRSGWRFWRDSSGKPIGESVGRFKA